MNLSELKKKVDDLVESVIDEYKYDPSEIQVSIQVDSIVYGVDASFSSDVNLIWDNDGDASGCVLYGDQDELD